MKALIIFFSLLTTSVQSQCYLEYFPGAGKEDKPIDEQTTGNFNVDSWLTNEVNAIRNSFDINAYFFVYDDGEHPNANAACTCSDEGCDGTVRLGKNLLVNETYNLRGNADAVVGFLAHEFAHILQCKKNWIGKGKEKELHADFMAGYYMGLKARFTYTNIYDFANALFRKGDANFFDENHHGTPDERVRFMTLGSYYQQLDVERAYRVGKKWTEGTIENHNISGKWTSTSGNMFDVTITPQGFSARNIANPMFSFVAGKIGPNVYRAIYFATDAWGRPVYDGFGQPVVSEVMDFTVLDDNELFVNSSLGNFATWTK